MNKVIILLAFALFGLTTSAWATPNQTLETWNYEQPNLLGKVTLTAGTLIYLETNERLNTEQATIGQMIKFKVKMNVVVKGKVVVRTGATAIGRIKSLNAATYNNPAEITIELTNVQAVDGQLIDLSGTEQTMKGMYPNQGTLINIGTSITANVMNDTEIKV